MKTLVNKITGEKTPYYEGKTEYSEEFWLLTDEEWDELAYEEELMKKLENENE